MTTLSLQVGASSDDARENSGTVGLTGTSINTSSIDKLLAFRWTGVTVPKGAPVTSAIISFYVTSTANDTPNGASVGVQDHDSAPTFTTASNDISTRSLTGTVTWSGSNIGAGWKTVDVTSLVQAVVNRSGWASGNALVVVVQGVSGTDLSITTWDGTPANAAKLDIEYTAASGGMAVKMMYYARIRRGG